ncbi:MAG: fucose isomerase, partial [Clostridium sp.]|nr:fucose isomerase [Clostridium sp.]
MNNVPNIKLGIVSVSRDCFPVELSTNRRKAVVEAYDGELYECSITVEDEKQMRAAIKEVKEAGVNA